MIEAILMLMLVIASAGVFVMCVVEIIITIKDKMNEKRMRHRRANKK
tara:strand:- start:10810 stop:10950 length:141 start_codon:yes stop_codon:yes gene_type:complete